MMTLVPLSPPKLPQLFVVDDKAEQEYRKFEAEFRAHLAGDAEKKDPLAI